MEEKEFQSKYTLDLDTYREFSKGYIGVKKIGQVFLVLFVLCGVSQIFARNYWYIFAFFGLWLLLMLTTKILNPTKVQYNRSISANGGKPLHHTVTINKDGILIAEDGGNKSNYKFEQIIGIGETKNLLILKMKYNLGIILRKDTLIGGSQEELANFLSEKCSNLKPKKIVQTKYTYIFQNCMFGIISAIFILAIVLFVVQGNTMPHWEKKLEENGYEVGKLETYANGRRIPVLQVLQEADATYIYEFKDRKEAEENIQEWADWEIEILEEALEKEKFAVEAGKNKKKYVIAVEEEVTVLIQKENYVFYGRSDKERKEELEKLADLLGF